jgi:hypothetical protein
MRPPVLASVGLLLTLSAGAHAQTTAPPPAPVLTVGSNLKELIFDWEPVAGAAIYRLAANTGPRGYFEPIGERLPASRTRAAVAVAVHTHEWWTRRYLVLACNPAGCTRSNQVTVTDEMLNTIGYVKASNTGAQDRLGSQVAMSADGGTMAEVAPGEDGATNSRTDTGAVYVYRRNGRRWAQEAVLRASDTLPNTRLGGGPPVPTRNVGLSADGSLLAVGAPSRQRSGHANSGVVFVYRRAADNRWSEVAQFTAAPAIANDYFGYSVDVSSDGNFVKASSMYPQGGAGTPEGRTHIWNWNGAVWGYAGAIAPFYPGDRCPTTRMTANARLLISACRTPSGEGRLVTHQRFAEQTWSRVADQPYLWFENPNMAVTYSGSWLALHEGNIWYPDGGIGIYRRDNITWVADAHWASTGFAGYNAFGHSMDFSRHGDYLAFSDPTFNASGAGVQEHYSSEYEEHGMVYFLVRRPEAIPQHFVTRYIKATNPGDLDRFGESVAFGGANGFYFAVGAPNEDSSALGVDGNQQSNATPDSGAVYLY